MTRDPFATTESASPGMPMIPPHGPTLLMVDDMPAEVRLIRNALTDLDADVVFHAVPDVATLFHYLYRQGDYAPPTPAPRPNLILLDLNMPGADGREAVARIKSDEVLRDIPVVVFTTSRAEEDVLRAYQLGANTYIPKPQDYEGLLGVMRCLVCYWTAIAVLPPAS